MNGKPRTQSDTADIERRAERLFFRWRSKDRPGLWEYAGEWMKARFRELATLRAIT